MLGSGHYLSCMGTTTLSHALKPKPLLSYCFVLLSLLAYASCVPDAHSSSPKLVAVCFRLQKRQRPRLWPPFPTWKPTQAQGDMGRIDPCGLGDRNTDPAISTWYYTCNIQSLLYPSNFVSSHFHILFSKNNSGGIFGGDLFFKWSSPACRQDANR